MPESNDPKDLFQFDDNEIIISFNARPGAETPQIVYHKLRKATLQELIEREQQSKYEVIEMTSREDEIYSDDDIANARLWDKIAVAVKGYRGNPDWLELTDGERARMRVSHKTKAILALYAGFCEIESDEEDSVSIGADIWTVRQNIGIKKMQPDYIVRHTLREPIEAERAKFKRSSSSTSHVKGAKKSQVRVRTHLKAYVELYDALIVSIDDATVHGNLFGAENRAQFLAAVDPVWKRQVIDCLMANLEAQLSD